MTPDAHFEIMSVVNPSDRLRDGVEWMTVFSETELIINQLAETEMEA